MTPPRRVRIALDGGGGDAGDAPVVEAALSVAADVDVVLVGPADLAPRVRGSSVELVVAPEVVGMDEDPTAAVWRKRGASVLTAAALVAAGRADAMVTPGNTGAAVLAATGRLGRLPGVAHPALATLLPVPRSTPTVLLDVGAASAASAAWLVQFAAMGAAYARTRLGVDPPRLGLLSNGREDVKGGLVQRSAHAALRGFPGYVGQVEGYDVLTGRVDVVVTDGFTGDVLLKGIEATIETTTRVVLRAVREVVGPPERSAVAAVEGRIAAVLAGEGGGVLLGLRGVCVVCHGAATAAQIARGVRVAARCVDSDVVGAVRDATRQRDSDDSGASGSAAAAAATDA